MFKWLFPKKRVLESQSTLPPSAQNQQSQLQQMDEREISKRVVDLVRILPSDSSKKVLDIRSRLADLAVTPQGDGQEQLDATNVSRQRVWGNQAVSVPIIEGSAEMVFCALLDCVMADYIEKEVTNLHVEEIAVPSSGEETDRLARAKQQMEQTRSDIDRGMIDYYEKKMMRHMRRKKVGKSQGGKPSHIREINVKLCFGQSFGPHRIIRVSDNRYYFMPCTVRA